MPNNKETSTRRFGWIPDVPDQRDHIYAATPMVAPHRLPPHLDLKPGCPPVYDQGNLGSCTANAIAGAIEFDLKQQKLPDFVPSRLFIYYNERLLEGTVSSDSGAMIRDGIKTVADQGECKEAMWPYDITKFATPPPQPCYQEAAKHKAVLYRRISHDVNLMKGCLAEGYPFVFGVAVYNSFVTQQAYQTGDFPLPAPGEAGPGPGGRPEGHAMLAVGYDDPSRRFLIRNSWGTGFGKKGYGTIPYDYLADPNLADDFWTIRIVQ